MKRISTLCVATCMAVGLQAGPTTIPLFENWTTLTNVPQIDALAFANYGSFSILDFFPVFTPGLAYDFSNVRAYTNRGVMYGQPGFIFDTIDDNGFHSPAEVFVNENGAVIQAFGGQRVDLGGVPARMSIHADNILNRGTLDVEASGLLEIVGDEVDLSRSGLGIQPILGGSGYHSLNPDDPTYLQDEGITDIYWGMGEQDPRFASSSLISSFLGSVNGRAPVHCVTNFLPGICFPTGFQLNDPLTFIYTNEVVTDTNLNFMIDMAVVRVADPNLNVQVNFAGSSQPTNFHRTIAVQLEAPLTNVIGGYDDSLAFYLVDRLGAETNFYLLTNAFTASEPLRPVSLEVTRNLPFEFAFGAPPNANQYRTNLSELLYNPGGYAVTNVVTNYVEVPVPPNATNLNMEIITNIVTIEGYAHDLVTNLYHGAAARLTNLVNEVPDVPGSSVTNSLGRVEIYAKSLNLERARIRGEGHVTIQTDHLESSRNAAIDGPSLVYDLASTNGTLRLQSLVLPEAQRLAGRVQTWGGVWTNTLIITTNVITNLTVTNIAVDDSGVPTTTVTNDPGTNVITTNNVGIGIHVTMVNAGLVRTRYPTYVNTVSTHSTNVFVADTTRVLENLMIDARQLTVESAGRLVLGDANSLSPENLTDWKADHFPNLAYLTNQGLIAAPSQILMGVDRATPYERIVVEGTNAARSHRYLANEFYNRGTIVSGTATVGLTNVDIFPALGPIQIEAGFMEFNGGEIEAGGDLWLTAGEIKMRNSTNVAARSLVLNVSEDLNDSGAGSNVEFEASQGIQLVRKPARGALLGTTVRLQAPQYQLVTSTWAAEDRGASALGYQDNAAVGRLVLSPASQATLELRGTGAKNAMYVDYLEIAPSVQGDLENALSIDPGLTVYFADANMAYDELTNAFPGRLVWVSDFVGPFSQVEVLLNSGRSVMVNRGLRESPEIDSDGDGIANKSDISPFDGAEITDFRLDGDTLILTWRAAAHTTYRVEAVESLPGEDWAVVREYEHAADDTAEVSIEDVMPAGSRERYYRVTYSP
ncbi:MAG: hypothetical protein H7A45_06540 [Verrucomicrobiales bacterium]|nr:hypothetical protein [Verrucomicrobiales bacterium]MCP5527597.1 hypothetical protein [Verrucomicrobiales bacterium]